MSFTGSSLYRLPVGAVPVKKPLQWLPVISPVDPGTSTRGLSTGGTVGVPVPVMFLGRCQETPFSGSSDQPYFDTGTSTRGLFTGGTVGGTVSGLYRLPVGAVPVKKPLHWLPVITPF